MAKWTGPLKSFDGREPNEDDSNGPFARRKTTDATHKDTIQIRVLDQIKAWRKEIIDELEASKEVASPEEVDKIEKSKVNYELKFNNIIESINRIVRSFENGKYYIGNKRDGNGEGNWERQDLDEIIVTIERESNYLTRSLAKLGLDSEEVDKLIGEADRWVKSLTTILYNLEDKESTSTNWNFADKLSDKFNVKGANNDVDDTDDEEDVEVEDDYENQPDEFVDYSDDEMDAMAWKGAEDFDPSDLELASVTPRRLNEEGTRLNVFGKHPGYRKKPMSLPQTGSDKEGIYRDWNDDSVYSEQPFGQEIGDSAPFDSMVKASVDSIVESLKKKL